MHRIIALIILTYILAGCSSPTLLRPELVAIELEDGSFSAVVINREEPCPGPKQPEPGIQELQPGTHWGNELVFFPRQALSRALKQKTRFSLERKLDEQLPDAITDVKTRECVGPRAFQIAALTETTNGLLFAAQDSMTSPWGIWLTDLNGDNARCVALGKSPAMLSKDAFIYTSSSGSIWRMNCDGSGRKRLLANSEKGNNFQAVVSPDGRFMAFVRGQANLPQTRDIWVRELLGSKEIQLTTHPSRDDSPMWSRDGNSIFFRSTRQQKWAIWRTSFSWPRSETGPKAASADNK